MAAQIQPAQIEDRDGPAWDALRGGHWEDARTAFAEELEVGESAELLEGFGRATRWLEDLPVCFEAQERAYLLYKERGDLSSAARVAINLGRDTILTRNDLAIGSGWFARAERLLSDQPECGVHAWLAFRRAQLSLYSLGELDAAVEHLNTASAIAQRQGEFDVEMAALSQLGLVGVTTGDIDGGMRALDEAAAAAVSGEVKLFDVSGGICCDVIFACEQVRDFDRASQWCQAASSIAERGMISPLIGVCRAHYASILIWQGDWIQAEEALVSSRELLDRHARGISREAIERLAYLRRLQGRLDEASELCEKVEWTPSAKLCQSWIAFERGDLPLAAELLEGHLRSVSGAGPLSRAGGLELGVQLGIATGDLDVAEAAATELRDLADELKNAPLSASASLARARMLVAAGDAGGGVEHFRAAIDLWSEHGAQFDTAVARNELGAALALLDRPEAAAAEFERAAASFTSIGAEHHARPIANGIASNDVLTAREVEVLQLVAEGLTNEEIAERLIVSPHTVHRHMANIRNKLDEPSRAAAVAHATREGLI